MTRRRAIVGACIFVLAVAGGCGREEENEAAVSQSLSVETFDFYFEPTSLGADVGAEVTVELMNNGSVSHTWTSTDLDAAVEAGAGEEATVTFTAPNEPGSYDFFCEFHPDEMQGTISIGGSDEPVEEQPEDEDEDDDVDVDVETENEDDTTGAGY